MVLRFASKKLLNLYSKCLILHLIKYIQRNKESKEKCSVSVWVLQLMICVGFCVCK